MTDPAYVTDAIARAKSRWGDVPVSAEVLYHEDGVGQVTVFHTYYSDEQRTARVELLFSPWFNQEQHVVIIPRDTTRVDWQAFDEDVPNLEAFDQEGSNS